MTIKADWIKILKRANTDAFTTRIPSRPYVAFIDGQIKLMCGAHVATWLQFFTAQFVGTIDQGFAAGAEVVVLGFDDYAFVPSAKNMTQIKRIKTAPPVEFGEHEELPQDFPDNWMDSIKNRAFKAKVITFVVCNVRRHYARETARTVIIDWRGPPEVIGRTIALPAMFAGEAAAAEAAAQAAAKMAWEAKAEKRAAKAARRAAKAAKAAAGAAAPATDYIDLTAGTESAGPTLNELNKSRQVHPNLQPALHWIQQARRTASDGAAMDCVPAAIQEAPPAVDAAPASAPLRRGECDTKAFSWLELGPMLLISTDGDYIPIALAQIERQGTTHEVYLHRMVCRSDGPGKRKPDGRPKREYEYANLNKLLSFIRAEFPKSKTPARTFAAMVALTGCDFTQNLPAASPNKLWAQRSLVRKTDVADAAGMQAFVVRVYNDMYAKKIRTMTRELRDELSEADGERLYGVLSTSMKNCVGIAARTRDGFFTPERMRAHVRNSLWTLSYWTELDKCPDPLVGDHGFERRGKFVAFVGTPEAEAALETAAIDAPDADEMELED